VLMPIEAMTLASAQTATRPVRRPPYERL
jgi:hypothetical protein